ncbi:MAG: alpha/beta hydrolase fold domain-containing protein [Novosphingobium sp.]|nr:alpha/beta hydrolase fold domain-containing protein [Novosphingobium sp.]
MIATLFAVWLLGFAATGYVRMPPARLPGNLLALWWLPSFLAQMLAGPLIVAGAISAVLLDGLVAKAAAALAALLVTLEAGKIRSEGLGEVQEMIDICDCWVCVDANYRLGPKDRFPAMLTDVLRAIAWTKAHIAEHGGDPARVALTGGSAGGHLTALGALAHDRAEAKPGFADVDCAVCAAVPCYGRFDFTDRQELWGRNHESMRRFEADKVMPADADDALWDLASPIALVRGDAPPMLVVHGCHDTLIPYEEGAAFAHAQREAGGSVDHIELAGGQHAFDMMQSALTWGHVRALRHWLERRV